MTEEQFDQLLNEMREESVASVSSSRTGTVACITIGPASRFSSTKCTVHPANFTPYSSACRCDSSPGNEGSNDG